MGTSEFNPGGGGGRAGCNPAMNYYSIHGGVEILLAAMGN